MTPIVVISCCSSKAWHLSTNRYTHKCMSHLLHSRGFSTSTPNNAFWWKGKETQRVLYNSGNSGQWAFRDLPWFSWNTPEKKKIKLPHFISWSQHFLANKSMALTRGGRPIKTVRAGDEKLVQFSTGGKNYSLFFQPEGLFAANVSHQDIYSWGGLTPACLWLDTTACTFSMMSRSDYSPG